MTTDIHNHSSRWGISDCRHPNCRARRLISTSVQDLSSSLGTYEAKDLDVLKAALRMAQARQAKTMTQVLESKIKKLEKVEA